MDIPDNDASLTGGLGNETEDSLLKRIVYLEALLEDMGHHLAAVEGGLAAVLRGEDVEGIPPAHPMRDVLWCCPACGHRLGVYDKQNALLRLRYKDFFVYVHTGKLGFVEVICRMCAERVRAQDNGDGK